MVKAHFLKLPRRLYHKNTYVQNINLEKQLLTGSHILSRYFSVIPIVVLDEHKTAVSRCTLTLYTADPAAYIGFFESVNDHEATAVLFEIAEKLAKQNGKTKLVGPLNASFWIGYRLKTNKFDSVYTSEPYNKEYYPDLWKSAGFGITDRYYSNALRVPKETDQSMKCKQRLQMVKDSGYEIQSPTKQTFNENLKEIYQLLIQVYSKFPMFKKIEEHEFCQLFQNLKFVLDFDFVKLIYKEKKLTGFFISVPDYKNLTHQKITIRSLLKILRMKNSSPQKYVLLYMGIDPKHPGLGSAMAELIKQELVKKHACSIGALFHEGKISGEYYKELAVDRYEYVLFRKEIL